MSSSMPSVQFSIQKKGYDPMQVEAYLLNLQDRINTLTNEITLLQEELKKAQNTIQAYEQKETTIQAALINANLAAEEILAEANEAAKKLVSDAKDHIEMEQKRTITASAEIKSMRERIKYILQSQLALLEEDDISAE